MGLIPGPYIGMQPTNVSLSPFSPSSLSLPFPLSKINFKTHISLGEDYFLNCRYLSCTTKWLWYLYILWNIHHSQANQHIHYLTLNVNAFKRNLLNNIISYTLVIYYTSLCQEILSLYLSFSQTTRKWYILKLNDINTLPAECICLPLSNLMKYFATGFKPFSDWQILPIYTPKYF